MKTIQTTKAQRDARPVRTEMTTEVYTQDELAALVVPKFQRPLRVNGKVMAVAEEIKITEVIPGIIILGRIAEDPKKIRYIIDGQHRIEGAKIAGVDEVLADVCIKTFAEMADMGEEFIQSNSQLVRMRPDDILRGLEDSSPAVKYLRKECPFVGYDQVRRSATTLVSMSAVLRCWTASKAEAPAATGHSATQVARSLTQLDAEQLARFLNIAKSAWGVDTANFRLWGTLNLALCMWLYNRLVIDRDRNVKRSVVLTSDQYKKCLMSVSANSDYTDWLLGRALAERDRPPCYTRLRTIFVTRLRDELKLPGGSKILMPAPSWASV